MAKSVLNFHSEVLGFHNTVCFAFPESESFDTLRAPQNEDLQVLYLLHGMHGGASSWLGNANVERYLRESGKKMVVVMPEMGNDFYTDHKIGWKYLTYVAEELPRIVETFLRVSPKRENTFVAGLSMGGYGAIKMALRYPEKFGFAASFSGCLDMDEVVNTTEVTCGLPLAEAENRKEIVRISEFVFGGPDKIKGSDNDLFHLLEAECGQKPELYVSCGTADVLFGQNERFVEKAAALGYGVTFHREQDEGHAWRFWDKEVEKLLRVTL
jgi:S-formylglutathione hydrolase FrmB